MAYYFNNFISQMILNIYNGFPYSTLSQGTPLVEESCVSIMDAFNQGYREWYQTVAEKDIWCFLCSWPYYIIACEGMSGSNVIMKIVNTLLLLDIFQSFVKYTHVKAFIKNSLACIIVNNYRPVSNLTVLSNLVERTVGFNLHKYSFNNNHSESL